MAEILGTDIKTDEYGDIQLTSTGDIDVVSDLPNMYQSIRNRLSLEKGELVYDSNYGLVFENFIGSKGIVKNINQFKLELIKELKKDSRITAINNIQISPLKDNPRAYEVVIALRVATVQEEVVISFVFPFYTPEVTAREIASERQLTTDKDKVTVEYTIYGVKSIYLTTDANKTGTNYYTGGYILSDKKTIVLGTPVTSPNTPVFINYTTLETERLGYTTVLSTELITFAESTSGDSLTEVTQITLSKDIFDVVGVWEETDTTKDGVNYYFGGSYKNNVITLGTVLPYMKNLIVEYYYYK